MLKAVKTVQKKEDKISKELSSLGLTRRGIRTMENSKKSVSEKLSQNLRAQKAFNEAALAFALPEYAKPLQYNSVFAREASTAFRQVFDPPVDFWATDSSGLNPTQDGTDAFAVLTRRPECAFIQYFANAGGNNYSYNLIMQDKSGGGEIAPPSKIADYNVNSNGTLIPEIAYCTSNDAFSPHGKMLASGLQQVPSEGASGYRWLPGISGEVYAGQFTNGSGQDITVSTQLGLWDGVAFNSAQATSSDVAVAAGATVNLSVTIPDNGSEGVGYYCLSFTLACAENIIIPVTLSNWTFSGAANVYGHQMLPDFQALMLAWTAVRINTASLRFSNRAAALYRGGNIIAAQVKNRFWTQYVGLNQAGYASLSNSYPLQSLDAKDGIYTFLLPTNEAEDFKWSTRAKVQNGILYDISYFIDDARDYLIVLANIPTSNNGQSQSGVWFATLGCEATSDTQCLRGTKPKYKSGLFEAGIASLSELQTVYENPLHMKDILNSIGEFGKKSLEAVVKYGPKVIALGELASKFFI